SAAGGGSSPETEPRMHALRPATSTSTSRYTPRRAPSDPHRAQEHDEVSDVAELIGDPVGVEDASAVGVHREIVAQRDGEQASQRLLDPSLQRSQHGLHLELLDLAATFVADDLGGLLPRDGQTAVGPSGDRKTQVADHAPAKLVAEREAGAVVDEVVAPQRVVELAEGGEVDERAQ